MPFWRRAPHEIPELLHAIRRLIRRGPDKEYSSSVRRSAPALAWGGIVSFGPIFFESGLSHLVFTQKLWRRVHAESGPAWNRPRVQPLIPTADEDLLVLLRLLVAFLHDQEVRNRRRQVDARRRADRSVRIVWDDRDVAGWRASLHTVESLRESPNRFTAVQISS